MGTAAKDLSRKTALLIDAGYVVGMDDEIGNQSYGATIGEILKKTGGQVVANVAALFAATHAVDNQLFQTLGYTTEGIGANLYRYDAGSSATIDGGLVMPGVGGTLAFTNTTFSGTAGVGRFVAVDQSTVEAEHFGAVGDGTTDSSNAVLRAVATSESLASSVRFGRGSFVVGDVHLPGVSVFGDANLGTKITAATGASYVFRLGAHTKAASYGWDTKVIADLQIDGNAKASDGLKWGQASNPHLAAQWVVRNCTLTNCSKALHKPAGNIGNTFDKLQIRACDYGMYAKANASPVMHCGNDTWRDGEINSCDLAAIYYDGTDETGTTTGSIAIENTIIEANNGFGVFALGVRGEATPLKLNAVYFELNAVSGSVTVDGTSYTPRDLRLEQTYAKLDNCGIYSMAMVDSQAIANFCKLPERAGYATAALMTIDDDSSLVVDNARITYRIQGDAIINSVGNQIYRPGHDSYPAGTYAPFFRAPRRTQIVTSPPAGGTLLASETFNSATPVAWYSSSSTQVLDGILGDYCSELTIADGSSRETRTNNVFKWVVTASEAAEWFVITGAIKCVGSDPSTNGLFVQITGEATQVAGFNLFAKQDEWVTVAALCHGVDTTNAGVNPTYNCGLYVHNLSVGGDGAASITVRVADWQALRFTKLSDAIAFVNSRQFVNVTATTETTGTGSPEGVVTAAVGSRYYRTDGGASTTLYVKESGTGNTGWAAK